MPHERGSTPVLPSEFFSIALADRKIRIRRELPATRPTPTASPPAWTWVNRWLKELIQKNLTLDVRLQKSLPLNRVRPPERHAPHFAPPRRFAPSRYWAQPPRRAPSILAR